MCHFFNINIGDERGNSVFNYNSLAKLTYELWPDVVVKQESLYTAGCILGVSNDGKKILYSEVPTMEQYLAAKKILYSEVPTMGQYLAAEQPSDFVNPEDIGQPKMKITDDFIN
eukprot:UN29015